MATLTGVTRQIRVTFVTRLTTVTMVTRLISPDMIFVKTFTLADFGPIIFYSKARNSRHIKFCDKTA